MGKVVLLVQYEIKENKRSEYLETIEKLKAHYATNQFVSYSAYEQKGKNNNFAELFLAHSEVVYKKFEESEDAEADDLAAKLADCIDGKTKYSTYFETK